MKRIALCATFGAALMMSGCGGNTSSSGSFVGGNSLYGATGKTSKEREDLVTKATKALEQGASAKVADAINGFGFSVFREVSAGRKEDNLMVSPLSATMALSMTFNGAEGETKKQMAKTLGYGDLSTAHVNEAYQQLRQLLANVDQKVQLDIANSLWAREGIEFKPDFISRNQQFYDAKLTMLDFKEPAAPKAINDWVREATSGKIPNIVDKIPEDAVLYLVNAVYFLGTWSKPFDDKLTTEAEFTLPDSKKIKVPTMNQQGNFRYYEGPHGQAVELPYGVGRLTMVAMLPPKGKSAVDFAGSLTNKEWSAIVAGLQPGVTAVNLPKFRYETTSPLKDVLANLGMKDAFSDKADFGAMRNEKDVKISQVLQKTFIQVNERGTEAAAVTSVEVAATSVQEPPKVRIFKADRPFLYVIRENETGVILFMGIVNEPKT